MNKLVYTLGLLAVTSSAVAQPEKMVTDRPGQTRTPFTVPEKTVQTEMGFMKEREFKKTKYNSFYIQHPTLLTKYGLVNHLELRLITEWATIKEESIFGDVINTGINSVQLGGKFNFLSQSGLRPKTSILAHYSFNGLCNLYKGKDSVNGANFRFAMQHTISDAFSIGYNIGMEWKWFTSPPAYIYTFSPKFNIGDKWFAYIELYGFIWKNQKPQTSIDGGIAYWINDQFKVDAAAGFGLSKKAPAANFSIGLSVRFNTLK